MKTAEILASRLRSHLDAWSKRADEELRQIEGDAPSLYVDANEARWSLQRDDLSHAAPARVRDVLEHLEPRVEEMARSEAERLETAVRAFVPPKLRAAVVARLTPEWPWSRVLATSGEVERDHGFTMLHVLAWHDARTRGVMEPPVSEIDRADAIRRTLAIVDPAPADVSKKQIDEWLRGHPPLAPDAGVWTVESASGRHLLSRTQLAWVCSAEARVEADRRRPAFPVAANRHNAAALSALTGRHAAPTGKITTEDSTGRRRRTLTIRAELHGRSHHKMEIQLPTGRTGEQLQLLGTGVGDRIDPERLADILQTVAGVDAVADYLILQSMAAKQGGRGRLTWTWEEHRHETFYEDLRKKGNVSDADMARAVSKRLKLLSALVLYDCDRDEEGNQHRRRIGEFGLIDIPETITNEDDVPIQFEIKLNLALTGQERATKSAGFVLVPDHVLRLKPRYQTFHLRILFADRRKTGSSLRLEAKTLWQYLGLKELEPRRWPAHAAAVARALDKIAAVDGMSWSVEGKGPRAIYTLTAAAWRDDRVLHHVPPVLAAPSTAQLPILGDALKDWRKAEGLTLDQLAAHLKKSGCRASRATVNRVETTGRVVPADWRRALAVLRGAAGR